MFETQITPRVSETDAAGHINNTVVPIWFEAGRREIFRILTPDLRFSSWKAALVSMTVDYTDQLYFNEMADVRTWVEKIGTKSFTLYEEIWQGSRRCAVGRAVYVCFDYAEQRTVPLPQSIRLALQCHLEKPDEQ